MPDPTDPIDYEVVIIGAGIHSLVTAKTFLQCNPTVDLREIEAVGAPGGAWKKDSLYEGLHTNGDREFFEFSDFPMTDGYGSEAKRPIPGPVVFNYLTDHAGKHEIVARLILNTRVVLVEKKLEGWSL